MRLCLLLAKDPTSERVGDTAMMRQLIDILRLDHDVSTICWSDQPERTDEQIVRLPKPGVSPMRIATRAAVRHRSLLHARYDDPALRAAIDASDAEAFVAVHFYLAEAFLRSSHRDKPLFVVNVVPEAPIWDATRGWLGRRQAHAIRRDEARIIHAAASVGSYDQADADAVARTGARRSTWLNITLPPRIPANVAASPARLAVLGDRTWAPNQRAWERMLELWPLISAGIPDAELVAIGRPADEAPDGQLPLGIRDLGFVDDLDEALATCRATAVAVDVGGGVRVKILESAAVGIPVVASTTGAGSLAGLFGLETYDTDSTFIARCRRLLGDPHGAADEGKRLHATNAEHCASGAAAESVRDWLA